MATPRAIICKGCWCQMRVPVPIRGPLSLPLRLFGIRRSRMNPNLCTVCEPMFRLVTRRRNVEAEMTILFADVWRNSHGSYYVSGMIMRPVFKATSKRAGSGYASGENRGAIG